MQCSDALAHLERAHPDVDSQPMRDVMGCSISGSEAVIAASGQQHAGMFEAPCGSTVMYAFFSGSLPTMGHYRWHSVYDHLTQGACPKPQECKQALATGSV